MRVQGAECAPARVEYAPQRLERSEFRAAMAVATWAAASQRALAGSRPAAGRIALVTTEPVAPEGEG